MNGIYEGDINDSISLVSIENYKATANQTDRIAILTNKKLMVKLHFSKELGRYVYCWGGECCTRYLYSNIRYVYPILVYPTDKKGNIIPGDVRVMRLTLPEKKDNSIRIKNTILQNVGKDITKVDLLLVGGDPQKIEGKGESKDREWVDYSIEDTQQSVAYKQHSEWIESIKEQVVLYKEKIQDVIAIYIKDDEDFREKLNQKNQNNVQQISQINHPVASLPVNTTVDDFFEEPVEKKEYLKEKVVEEKETVIDDDFDLFS